MIEQAAGRGWDVLEFRKGSRVQARVAVKGSEVHMEVVEGPVFERHRARRVVGALLEGCGYLTTRHELGDERSQRFVERLGFKPTWSDEKYTYYMLTENPFSAKEN